MFNPQACENSRPDGIGVLGVVDGQKSDQHHRFVPLKRTELHGEVLGPLAAMRIVQTYGYTRHQCDQAYGVTQGSTILPACPGSP